MTKKGNLFFLIHSLTKSEKRYIKLFVGGKEDTIYLRLFDAIEAQETYDESEIKKRFKGEKFLTQLHVTKIYLTELILKALKSYSAGNTVNSQLLNLLGDIEVLFARELYDLCYYKIEKAEKLAARYEKLGLLYELLTWKRKLSLTGYVNMAGLAVISEKDVINKMSSQNFYWHHALNIPGYPATQDTTNTNSAFNSDSQALTLQAKSLRRHLIYTRHFVNGDLKAAEVALNRFIRLLENNTHRIKDDPATYVTVLSNKIGLFLGQKRWRDIPALIETIKAVPAKYKFADTGRFTVRLWLRVYNIELELYRDSKQLDKGLRLIKEVARFMDVHRKSVPPDYFLLLYYQFSSVTFLKKNFSEALKWVNLIINNNFGQTRHDIQAYARILNLFIHFELGNIIVLRYAIDSCRRFLKKNKMMGDQEKNILLLFSKLSHANQSQVQDIYRAWYRVVDRLEADAPLRRADYIDVKGWLAEKAGRKA